MGLRDRIRVLLRPPVATAPVPPSRTPPPALSVARASTWSAPQCVTVLPPGVPVIAVGPDVGRPAGRFVAPGELAKERGPVAVVSAAGGRWASAAAELLAARGEPGVVWLAQESA